MALVATSALEPSIESASTPKTSYRAAGLFRRAGAGAIDLLLLLHWNRHETTEPALELARTLMPDVVLLDVSMPGISGTDLCRQLRAQDAYKGVRIVAYTAHALVSERADILAAGFDAYLPKPVDITTLLQTVELLLLRTERSEIARERAVSERMASLGTLAAGVAPLRPEIRPPRRPPLVTRRPHRLTSPSLPSDRRTHTRR